MFAIVKTGGKQYKVSEGDLFCVEKLDAKVGDKIELPEVLLLWDEKKFKLGTPFVEGAKVTCEVIDQIKDKKIKVVKFHPKKRYKRVKGHRQRLTILKVIKISLSKKKKDENNSSK